MKITFLGTGAHEGVPAVFCNCKMCREAKELGGKNIRTRSQIMINDNVLIDFPMDTYFHMITNRLDLSKVSDVFITHAHMDHCYPQEFTMHGAPYAHNMVEPILNIYGNKTVIERTEALAKPELKYDVQESLKLKAIKPYHTVQLKNLTVTSLPAIHTANEDCLIYLIEDEKTCFLQFNDSGILDEEVYDFLAARKRKIDIVSYDCTYGYSEKGKGRHMGVIDNINERNRMSAKNIIHDKTQHILTHFSHNGGLNYLQLCEKVTPHGFTVAYDGMVLSL